MFVTTEDKLQVTGSDNVAHQIRNVAVITDVNGIPATTDQQVVSIATPEGKLIELDTATVLAEILTVLKQIRYGLSKQTGVDLDRVNVD